MGTEASLMSTLAQDFITPEKYLEIERKAEAKSEHNRGEMFRMSGASREPCRLASGLNSLLETHLRPRGREVYASDMRVRVSPTAYPYPDVTMVLRRTQVL